MELVNGAVNRRDLVMMNAIYISRNVTCQDRGINKGTEHGSLQQPGM
jgi:hypothetical protein